MPVLLHAECIRLVFYATGSVGAAGEQNLLRNSMAQTKRAKYAGARLKDTRTDIGRREKTNK